MTRAVLIGLLLVIGATILPASAFPCPGDEAWYVEPVFGSDSLRAPADGPLIVRVAGPNSPADFDPGELRFWVIDSLERKLTGTLTVGGQGDRKSILWVPDEPLIEETYRVEIRHPAGGGLMKSTELDVIELPEQLDEPLIQSVRAWEVRHPVGEKQCCEAAQCRADACGPAPESCESCWYDAYEFPVSMLLRFDYPTSFPSHWLDVRYFQVNTDGTESPIDFPARARFPEGSEGPFCVVVELEDVVGGQTSRAEACADEVNTVSREIDNDFAKAQCVTAEETSTSSCSAASGSPSALVLLLGLFGFGRLRRRRA